MKSILSFLSPISRDPAIRQRRDFLRKIFLFRELDDRSVEILSGKLLEKAYGQGDVIFQEGDVGRALFIVLSGRIDLSRKAPASGDIEPLALLGPGDFFGEMVLLDELPRSATARASEPATLAILYKAQFDELFLETPTVAAQILRAISRLLSARLRRAPLPASSQAGPV